jgi:microcompartment protein CcmK/EutM
MILGRVIGTVWATRKDEQTVGMKFQIVREVELDYTPKSGFVVAVDSVGAGVGEIVLVAQGSSGRQTELTRGKPVDAVIMAIVDRLDVDEDEVEEVKRRARTLADSPSG